MDVQHPDQNLPAVSVTIPHYHVVEVLGEGHSAIVYKAYRLHDPDRQPLTLKVFKHNYLAPGQHERLRHELYLVQRLDSPYLVQGVQLEDQGGIVMLVGPYDDLQSLQDWLRITPFSVTLFLKVAIHLARALEDIHDQGVMHGDLKPSNVLIDTLADRVKIIDFGIAQVIEQIQVYADAPEGTLAYISPEQTGRTGKPVDYRSDFYALGVTLFEMATRQLPFVAHDRLSLIHAHLAATPPAAHTLNPALPLPLSDLIHRLMAKNPEDRYQTAAAIRADLERCQIEWLAHGSISPFELDSTDWQQRLAIAPGLYGRVAEMHLLIDRLRRIGETPPRLMLISGSSGVGKSALVQELQPEVQARGWMFVATKYDRYQRSIPYNALVRALQTCLRTMLRMPAAVLHEWQVALQAAVGVNGQLIADVVPEVELLLGPQPAVPDLPPEQAQGRFTQTLSAFLRACGSASQPLILFLDDLHWADESSLDFLQSFFADTRPAHLLILGAYRESKVGTDHHLRRLIAQLSSAAYPLDQIHLHPLDYATIRQWLVDTFASDRNDPLDIDIDIDYLADLLYRRSGGNPFFFTTLLRTFYDDELISYVPGVGWTWDLVAIAAAHLSDDVIDLVIQRLDRLATPTLDLLKVAACLGTIFSIDTLSLVTGLDRASLSTRLEPALRDDVLHHQDEETIRFGHGRVQDAVYLLMSETERQRQHWQIGSTLLAAYDAATLDDQLFTVVNQLNQGRILATDPAQLLELNYRAGLRARASAAFDASLNYLQVSRDLLPPDAWHTNYAQTYAIWSELLLANFLVLDIAAAREAADVLLTYAHSDLDRARCYRQLVMLYAAQADAQQAIAVGKRALALYGQDLPSDSAALQQALCAAQSFLEHQVLDLETIRQLPTLQDEAALMQLEIRSELIAPLYRVAPELFALNTIEMIRLGLEYGSHPALTLAFGGHASALIAQGQLEQSALFYRLSTVLWERYPNSFETAQTIVAVAWALSLLQPDLAALRELNRRGQALCANHSHISYLGISIALQTMTEVLESNDLVAALGRAEAFRDDFFRRYQVERYRGDVVVASEVYLKPLLGREASDRAALAQEFRERRFFGALFHLHILAGLVAYTMGNYGEALAQLSQAEEFVFSNRTGLLNPLWRMYHALSLLALAQEQATPDEQIVAQAIALLQRVEALTVFTATFRPHIAFVQAELAFLRREWSWHSSFVAAVEQAAAAGYTLLQATIHERMARHLLAAGHRFGRGHLEEALYLFEQCGAVAKVQQLQQAYALYFQPLRSSDNPFSTEPLSSSAESSNFTSLQQNLDLYAILKASQAISSEIDSERVLATIMQTIGEVSGAQTAYLVMEQAGELMIVAGYPAAIAPAAPLPIRENQRLSAGVIRYVQRTQRTLLLDNANQEGEFSDDPYISSHAVRSLLCQPIQEQNRMLGIIYLENNLSSYAFATDRVEVVRLLAAQAAISITNAQAVAVRSEQERVRRELEIAHAAQQSMLPRTPPQHPHYDIAGVSHAARQVSGDLYGYYSLLNGGLAVAVGDVTGKGISAALLMSAAVVALSGSIEVGMSPGLTLAQTHRVLQPYTTPLQNVAICLAYLEQPRVRIANAGAVAPIIRSADTVQLIDLGGLPLATPLSGERPYREAILHMGSNDLIILSSDGLVEATNISGERYGFERLTMAVAAGPNDSAEAMLRYLLAAVSDFVGAAEMHDDITVLVVRRR